jgi:hypothetical protein
MKDEASGDWVGSGVRGPSPNLSRSSGLVVVANRWIGRGMLDGPESRGGGQVLCAGRISDLKFEISYMGGDTARKSGATLRVVRQYTVRVRFSR